MNTVEIPEEKASAEGPPETIAAGSLEDAGSANVDLETSDAESSRTLAFRHTRTSAYWAAVVVGLITLVVLIIFILENGQRAKVSFFGAHTHLPQGAALLLAAVIGGVFVMLAGVARILQLRIHARRTVGSSPRRRYGSRRRVA